MLDILEIATNNGMTQVDLSLVLFPNNKRPLSALKRVLNGETFLDERQISRLAAHFKVSIPELYEMNGKTLNFDDHIEFRQNNCYALFDLKTFRLDVFHKTELIHDTVILKTAITAKELINYIKTIYSNK